MRVRAVLLFAAVCGAALPSGMGDGSSSLACNATENICYKEVGDSVQIHCVPDGQYCDDDWRGILCTDDRQCQNNEECRGYARLPRGVCVPLLEEAERHRVLMASSGAEPDNMTNTTQCPNANMTNGTSCTRPAPHIHIRAREWPAPFALAASVFVGCVLGLASLADAPGTQKRGQVY